MMCADPTFAARAATTLDGLLDTPSAASTPAQIARCLTEHCVHTLGLAGATVLLLDPALCTVGLVAAGPGEAALRERLVAARALAHEVLRRGSWSFIEQAGRPVPVAVASLPTRRPSFADARPDDRSPVGACRPDGDGIEIDATAYALPLRVGPVEVGSLVVLCIDPDGVSEEDLRLVHAAADASAELLSTAQAKRDQTFDVEQLRVAVDSRVFVEQATGVIGERFDVGMVSALELLRTAAASSGRPLEVVAREVVLRRRLGIRRR